jgi:hypothetical protein
VARNLILMKTDKRVYRLCRNIGMIRLLKLVIFALCLLSLFTSDPNTSMKINHIKFMLYCRSTLQGFFLSVTIVSQCLSCVSIVVGSLFLTI